MQRTGWRREEKLLTVLIQRRNPTTSQKEPCRQSGVGSSQSRIRRSHPHGRNAPMPQNPSLLSQHLVPLGPCPWRSIPRGRNPPRALPLQPPGELPRRGGLTRLAKMTTVITLSFRCITVINSLNNSKGNYSNNNSTHHSTTRCSNATTNSENPSRAREPKRRTRAPQGARSALFISITTN